MSDDYDNDYDVHIDVDSHKDVDVYYIWGPKGSGKLNKALKLVKIGFDIISYADGCWKGVSNYGKCCLYENFRDSNMSLNEFIRFIDNDKHTMSVRGGLKPNEYTTIIIISKQDPHYIYKNADDETRKQWLKRMKIINMNP